MERRDILLIGIGAAIGAVIVGLTLYGSMNCAT